MTTINTTTTSDDDGWITSAMTDACLVADLLVRLKEPVSLSPKRWGTRKPRSKAAAAAAADPTRWSPTTPLSWSGGGGGGGGVASGSEGCEESSLRWDSCLVVRSKGIGTNEASNASNKSSRRKKTFAELIEEEVSLLKERSCLKRELATLHVTVSEQRSLNQNLKRIKANSGAASNGLVIQNSTNAPCLTEASTLQDNSSCAPKYIAEKDHLLPQPCLTVENTRGQERAVFLLPDLNMTPDEDCGQ